MKPEKAAKAPHVLLVSKRFNEVRVSIIFFLILRGIDTPQNGIPLTWKDPFTLGATLKSRSLLEVVAVIVLKP